MRVHRIVQGHDSDGDKPEAIKKELDRGRIVVLKRIVFTKLISWETV